MKKSAFVLYLLSLVIIFMACFGSAFNERKSLAIAKIEVKKSKLKDQKQEKEEKEKEKEETDSDDENEKEERSFEKEVDWNHANSNLIELNLIGLDITSVSPYKGLNAQCVIAKIFTPPKC